jgi:hypothetical protein
MVTTFEVVAPLVSSTDAHSLISNFEASSETKSSCFLEIYQLASVISKVYDPAFVIPGI